MIMSLTAPAVRLPRSFVAWSRSFPALAVLAVVTVVGLAVAAPADAADSDYSYRLGVPSTPTSSPFSFDPFLASPLHQVFEAGNDDVVIFDGSPTPLEVFAYTTFTDLGQPSLDKEFRTLSFRQSAGSMDALLISYRTSADQGWLATEGTADPYVVKFPVQDEESEQRIAHGTAISLRIRFRAQTVLSPAARLEDITITYRRWVEPPPGDEDDDTDDDEKSDKNDKGTGGGTGSGVFIYPSGDGTGSGGDGGSGTGTGGGGGDGTGNGHGQGGETVGPQAAAAPYGATGPTGYVPVDSPAISGSMPVYVSGKAVTMSTLSLDEASGGGDAGGGGPNDGPRERVSRWNIALSIIAAALTALLIVPGIVMSRRHRRVHRFDHIRGEKTLPEYVEGPAPVGATRLMALALFTRIEPEPS